MVNICNIFFNIMMPQVLLLLRVGANFFSRSILFAVNALPGRIDEVTCLLLVTRYRLNFLK